MVLSQSVGVQNQTTLTMAEKPLQLSSHRLLAKTDDTVSQETSEVSEDFESLAGTSLPTLEKNSCE